MKKQRIILENITKSFDGNAVIEDLSAEISENTALMGASGEGKTTLSRIIMGLESADAGNVKFDRAPTFSAVFQEDRLFEDFSAVENVALAYGKGKGKADAKRDAASLLSSMNIAESEQLKRVSVFSGGMKRRVALARALAKPSDILVLDEPFKGLDKELRRMCAEFVRERAQNRLILLITHDMTEAELLGIDRILNI